MCYSKTIGLILFASTLFCSCGAQQQENGRTQQNKNALVGGGCDGCELMFVNLPPQIYATDTSAGWNESGKKLLITGKILQPGGARPASGVILYYWQTDNAGYYSPGKDQEPATKRHGHIRGWVMSDESGNYSIYTIRPGAYPGEDIPAHIHVSIKEPGIANEYYIDELVFDDDPLLTTSKRRQMENRGGSGVLRLIEHEGMQVAEHNIILGLHIPGHPGPKIDTLQSGLDVGEDSPSFTPYHAWGPDKGSTACPVCKYGRHQGILFFVGNRPAWVEIRQWLLFFEKLSLDKGKYLKVYFVYGNDENYSSEERKKQLAKLGEELQLKQLALTFVPSFMDEKSDVADNQINPLVSNTIIIYKHSNIIAKYINRKPNEKNFGEIINLLADTRSPYADKSENHAENK